jgi:hypothetical protein
MRLLVSLSFGRGNDGGERGKTKRNAGIIKKIDKIKRKME